MSLFSKWQLFFFFLSFFSPLSGVSLAILSSPRLSPYFVGSSSWLSYRCWCQLFSWTIRPLEADTLFGFPSFILNIVPGI